MAAAYLSCKGAQPQEIAKILNIGIASVYRAIKEAVDSKLISPQPPIFVRSRVEPDVMAEVEVLAGAGKATELLGELGVKLGLPVPTVQVVNSGLDATIPDGDAGMRALERFGAEAAALVRQIVEAGNVCGVSWGQTISAVVSGIERSLLASPRDEGDSRFINFVPVVGEFPGTLPTQTSASSLALRLTHAFNREKAAGHSYSLAGLPALIPADFGSDEIAVVDRLAYRTHAYRAIFGADAARSHREDEDPPLINRLDSVLTSVGPSGQPFGSHADRFLGLAGLTMKQLEGGCDIAGVLLRPPKVNGERIMKTVRERWRGVTMEDLRRCAAKARDRATGGVVVVAAGANKAETLWDCIREQLVSHVLVDRGLLLAFEKHLKRVSA